MAALGWLMKGVPVPSDVDPPAQPHTFMTLDVVDESDEARCTPRPPYEPTMKADAHHLRSSLPLPIERVEAVLEIGEELVPSVEALSRRKPHVVCVESVW